MKTILTLSTASEGDALPSVAELLAIRDAVVAVDSSAQFRETDLRYYDAGHFEDEKDMRNFMEDLYDWADANDVRILWRHLTPSNQARR